MDCFTSTGLLLAFIFSSFTAVTQVNSLMASDGINDVSTDKSGITIETKIVVEQEGDKTKIIFLQETENGFIFKRVNWKGDVTLLLDNGTSIVLKDSNIKGSSIERATYVAGFYVPDIYERYAAYYLTDEDCNLLKKHSIVLISYYLDDKYDKKPHYIEISDNNRSLNSQLAAIGK